MNLHKEIQEIKLKRDQFLKSFTPGEVTANDIVKKVSSEKYRY